jgi:hypothetical protein
MDRARYHHDPAQALRKMAQHASDPLAVSLFRAVAAEHLARVQNPEEPSSSNHSAESNGEKCSDDFSDSFYFRLIRTGIGRALQSVPTEPASERLSEALETLDRATGGEAAKVDGRGMPDDLAARARSTFSVIQKDESWFWCSFSLATKDELIGPFPSQQEAEKDARATLRIKTGTP